MNFLKRRFSDLGPLILDTVSSTQEALNQNLNNPSAANQQQQHHQQVPGQQLPNQQAVPGHPNSQGVNSQPSSQSHFQRQENPGPSGASFAHPPTTQPRSNFNRPGAGSAPSSPPEQRKMQSVNSQSGPAPQQQTGGAAQAVGGFFSSLTQKAQNVAETAKVATSLSKFKILLVIDDAQTDWSRYFRGRKVYGDCDYDIRVEQAEFHELFVKSHSETGTSVEMHISRGGPKVVRTFKPDFVLVRQQPKTASYDYTNLLVAFQFGCVPSVNSWTAMFNFQNKPWTFAQLVSLQKRLGKEKFPLITQAFYPTSKQMNDKPRFPVVLKVGHAHAGAGKVKIDNAQTFEDTVGIVDVSNTFCTSEPYIDSKFDFRIQKIGQAFKVYMRTSSSSVWKSNLGSAVVEQVNMNDTFRMWMDSVSELFGGLDMCAISALRGRDNKDYIIEVNDCCMPLIGDKQEEDKRAIADLVMNKMELIAKGLPDAKTNLWSGSSSSLPNGVAVASGPKRSAEQPPYKPPASSPSPSSQQLPQRPVPAAPTAPMQQSSPTMVRAPQPNPTVPPSQQVPKQSHQLPPTPQQQSPSQHRAATSAAVAADSRNRSSSMRGGAIQNPSPLTGSRVGGAAANYYVAGKYPPSTANIQPLMARDGSFRLSRFGRKVLAVARLKKMTDDKQRRPTDPTPDMSKMGGVAQTQNQPQLNQGPKSAMPNQPPKSPPEPTRPGVNPPNVRSGPVPTPGPAMPPPRQQPGMPNNPSGPPVRPQGPGQNMPPQPVNRPAAGPPRPGSGPQMPAGARMNGPAQPALPQNAPPSDQPDDASIKKLRNAFSSFFE